jgi:hypothetical protein
MAVLAVGLSADVAAAQGAADLQIRKVADQKTVKIGERVTYTITLRILVLTRPTTSARGNRATTARRSMRRERRAAFLDRQLPGSGWDPPKRHRKRRLPRIKGVEITDELQTRNVPTVVVRQKIERRRVGVPLALEQHAEVGVAKVAEHQARHVAGS